jgi:DNA-binding NarL/FixJ family response regulator
MRVMIADDAVLLREGLARLLVDDGFEVVAQAGDAEALLRAVERRPPDVAIIDVRMPPTHTDEGLRAAETIRAHHPTVGLLVLSQHPAPPQAMRLLNGGSRGVGYLLKDRVGDLQEFAATVRRVGNGGSAIDPALVRQLIDSARSDEALETLSRREREILALMAEGRSNRAIATALFLGVKTIETHISTLFAKLDLAPAPDDHRRVLAVIAYLRTR